MSKRVCATSPTPDYTPGRSNSKASAVVRKSVPWSLPWSLPCHKAGRLIAWRTINGPLIDLCYCALVKKSLAPPLLLITGGNCCCFPFLSYFVYFLLGLRQQG